MNIYFSCSLTGGRNDEAVYGVIVDHLLALGHDVPTSHLARPEVMHEERVIDPAEVFRRDTAWIQACDALIAEVTTPSHGVGYEIAYALTLGKPVLCVHAQDAAVSKMLSGNSLPGIQLYQYATHAEALTLINAFLAPMAAALPDGARRIPRAADQP